jgi:hypothetical protein
LVVEVFEGGFQHLTVPDVRGGGQVPEHLCPGEFKALPLPLPS